MQRSATVICGGGIAGLSSAYWLGRMQRPQRQNTSIIVLEARSQCFQGASGHNSGLLSYHWFSSHLRQLADHSFRVYQDLAREQPGFKYTCDYNENSLFQAHCGEGATDPRAPHWINIVKGWHLESEPAMPTVHDDPSSATMYV